MKTKTPVLVTVLGFTLLTGLAIAATTAARPPSPGGPRDQFRARIAEKLGLTADQQKAIQELRAKQKAEMMALLTPEQQKQADELRGQVKARFHRFGQFVRGRLSGGQGGRHGPAMQPGSPASPLAVVAMGERIKDHVAEKLELTGEQRDRLEQLGRAYRAQQRDAAKKHFEEMRAVLTPEQQQKFEQMKQHSRRGPAGGHPPFLSLNDGPEDDTAVEPARPLKES